MNLDEITQTLKRHEGVRQYAYRCPAGYWTIGAGRNVDETGGRAAEEMIDSNWADQVGNRALELADIVRDS